MGRPQSPLERDGSPRREFAFWLRDLRARSGLTYEQLARVSNYATSTMQDAAAGQRLPTLPVVRAFVRACGDDEAKWETYWTQIRRIIDPDTPYDMSRAVEPPWADASGRGENGTEGSGTAEGWYLQSLVAEVRLDAEPIEAIEKRLIVATVNGLAEIATSVSVPRHPDDTSESHELEAELLDGGSLEQREQPFQSYFRNVVALPRPLQIGDHHEYTLRLRIPRGQPMAPHYVHVPLQRSDHFDLLVRFNPLRPPQQVWKLEGVSTTVLYERNPASELIAPDETGEVHVTFRGLRQGLSYGVSWMP